MKPEIEAKIFSIGIAERGTPVARIIVDGKTLHVALNHIGFADLAAAGVKVVNHYAGPLEGVR